MFKFIQRLFAPQPQPAQPMAVRRKRPAPVYVLPAKKVEGVNGNVAIKITEIRRGHDVSSS